ncbi:hypothetical protein DFH07DRAFT_959130 [Mycena maculata]|uniref:Secreted protein n=1 Tax=Mycena maculata TaxID=230809 RepID=A0AAD7NCU3_9AGAR|nr:hypothetical protein DFH07DRAFT_959130 [Mycena maculata]
MALFFYFLTLADTVDHTYGANDNCFPRAENTIFMEVDSANRPNPNPTIPLHLLFREEEEEDEYILPHHYNTQHIECYSRKQ